MEYHGAEAYGPRGHDDDVALAEQGVRLRDVADQVNAIGEVELPHLGCQGLALGAVARDHPMQVGATGSGRPRRPNQGALILGRLERRDVGGDRSAARQPELRPEVEWYGGGATHFVGIDAGGNDVYVSRADPGGQECRPHGLGNRYDGVRMAQRTSAAYREDDPTSRDDTRRRAREGEKAARPDRNGDGVVVVCVNEIRWPGPGFGDEPPPGPGVEPERPGDLPNGDALGGGAARELAAPEFAAGVDVEDPHPPLRPAVSRHGRGRRAARPG